MFINQLKVTDPGGVGGGGGGRQEKQYIVM